MFFFRIVQRNILCQFQIRKSLPWQSTENIFTLIILEVIAILIWSLSIIWLISFDCYLLTFISKTVGKRHFRGSWSGFSIILNRIHSMLLWKENLLLKGWEDHWEYRVPKLEMLCFIPLSCSNYNSLFLE